MLKTSQVMIDLTTSPPCASGDGASLSPWLVVKLFKAGSHSVKPAGMMNMSSEPQVEPTNWKTKHRLSAAVAKAYTAATSRLASTHRWADVAAVLGKQRVWIETRSPKESVGNVVIIVLYEKLKG